MGAVQRYRDLDVYHLARDQARINFEITSKFYPEERYSLTDQIRRSSRAVNAMLAEAWARRRYPAAFVNKLNEALGEAVETQSWLDHALECGCIDANRHREFDDRWQHVGAMLNRMIDMADTFCHSAPP